MTPNELRDVLAQLGLTQVGASKLLCMHVRPFRRYLSGHTPIPHTVVLCFRRWQERQHLNRVLQMLLDYRETRQGIFLGDAITTLRTVIGPDLNTEISREEVPHV